MGNNGKVLKKHNEGMEKHNGVGKNPTKNKETKGHKLTFTEYLVRISKSIDKKIISQERKGKMVFAGGYAKFSVDRPEHKVKFAIEYYYKSKKGQWMKQTEEGSTEISQFNNSDEKTLKFLDSSETLEIPIEPPHRQ